MIYANPNRNLSAPFQNVVLNVLLNLKTARFDYSRGSITLFAILAVNLRGANRSISTIS
jgi:hypothetical protein